MPKLHFQRFDNPDLVRSLELVLLPGLQLAFQQKPSYPNARELALGLLVFGHYQEAIPFYQGLAERIPLQPANWENLAMCHLGIHDLPGALAAMRQALRVAHEIGDSTQEDRLQKRCSQIVASM